MRQFLAGLNEFYIPNSSKRAYLFVNENQVIIEDDYGRCSIAHPNGYHEPVMRTPPADIENLIYRNWMENLTSIVQMLLNPQPLHVLTEELPPVVPASKSASSVKQNTATRKRTRDADLKPSEVVDLTAEQEATTTPESSNEIQDGYLSGPQFYQQMLALAIKSDVKPQHYASLAKNFSEIICVKKTGDYGIPYVHYYNSHKHKPIDHGHLLVKHTVAPYRDENENNRRRTLSHNKRLSVYDEKGKKIRVKADPNALARIIQQIVETKKIPEIGPILEFPERNKAQKTEPKKIGIVNQGLFSHTRNVEQKVAASAPKAIPESLSVNLPAALPSPEPTRPELPCLDFPADSSASELSWRDIPLDFPPPASPTQSFPWCEDDSTEPRSPSPY